MTTALNAHKPVPCWDCGAEIDAGDAYCRRCGKGQGDFVPWQYKHWGVIALTLAGLGPLTLYYLWRSPVISRNAKMFYAPAILAVTWVMIKAFTTFWGAYQALLGGGMQLY